MHHTVYTQSTINYTIKPLVWLSLPQGAGLWLQGRCNSVFVFSVFYLHRILQEMASVDLHIWQNRTWVITMAHLHIELCDTPYLSMPCSAFQCELESGGRNLESETNLIHFYGKALLTLHLLWLALHCWEPLVASCLECWLVPYEEGAAQVDGHMSETEATH